MVGDDKRDRKLFEDLFGSLPSHVTLSEAIAGLSDSETNHFFAACKLHPEAMGSLANSLSPGANSMGLVLTFDLSDAESLTGCSSKAPEESYQPAVAGHEGEIESEKSDTSFDFPTKTKKRKGKHLRRRSSVLPGGVD